MSVFGRDESNYDGDSRHDGMTFMTHKATEGTTVVHDRYGPRLNEWRAAGVPVLGAYHVVRTPGSGGHGSLAAQLRFWLGYLDAQTPWWRSWPAFILQVDAETWTYDAVSAGNVKAFAALLVGAGVPGWKVTYASRGQYGDRLAGIATPLWNADYRGSVGGSYPGDGWTTQQGQAAGWAPYSGQRPALLQFASTPHDLDAFPGTQAALVALIQGDTMALTDADVEFLTARLEALTHAYDTIRTGPEQGKPVELVALVKQAAAAGAPSNAQVAAGVLAALQDPAVQAGLVTALLAHVKLG